MATKRSLLKYLLLYNSLQDDITLVYRPSKNDNWSNRVIFLSEDYDPRVEYNHRSILRNEIVIEYDTDSKEDNRNYVGYVAEKLRHDNIPYSMWDSGNKSRHLHFFINIRQAKRINILKSVVMRHYGTIQLEDKKILPDTRLSANNSLIRAEYGINEKTGGRKTLVVEKPNYPYLAELPEEVWIKYASEVKRVINTKLSNDTKTLHDHPLIKYILSTNFRDAEDGRERALFILIHVLKPLYVDKKDELIKYLQEWYKYSGGYKLNDWAIQCKVNYHWLKKYTVTENFIKEFIYSIVGDEKIIENIIKRNT